MLITATEGAVRVRPDELWPPHSHPRQAGQEEVTPPPPPPPPQTFLYITFIKMLKNVCPRMLRITLF